VVPVEVAEVLELGAHFYQWEVATAIAGHVLGIDPFDEPNVSESKANTRRVLGSLPLPADEESAPADLVGWLESQVRERDYISIQAYLPYGQDAELEAARRRVRDRFDGMAVTAGYGPRFLHSTGQLHKGGPDEVVAIQVLNGRDQPRVDIPGHPYDFATLIAAQSLGDHESLLRHRRRVLRVRVEDLGQVG